MSNATHLGRRVPNSGKCGSCGTKTNWMVRSFGEWVYWCGCGWDEMKKASKPLITAEIWLVRYGYQINVIDDRGQEVMNCRDFGGEYPIRTIIDIVTSGLLDFMHNLEKNSLRLIKRKKKAKTK